eukprot:561939-Amphidinium_carterae.1
MDALGCTSSAHEACVKELADVVTRKCLKILSSPCIDWDARLAQPASPHHYCPGPNYYNFCSEKIHL